MSQDQPSTVLARVQADIVSHEAAIAAFKRQMEPHQAAIAKLREFEAYLHDAFPDASAPLPAMSHPLPRLSSPPSDDELADIPTHALERHATTMLGQLRLGETAKARDVAVFIAPGYDSDNDNRNFENRIFSVLRRRPEQFVKIGRGNWALRSIVESHPELYRQEENEPTIAPALEHLTNYNPLP